MTATKDHLAALKEIKKSIKTTVTDRDSLDRWIDDNTDLRVGSMSGAFNDTYKLKDLPYVVKFSQDLGNSPQKLYANIPEGSALAKRFLRYLMRGYISKDFRLAFAFQLECKRTKGVMPTREYDRFIDMMYTAKQIAQEENLKSVSICNTYCGGNDVIADLHGGNGGFNDGKLVIFDW